MSEETIWQLEIDGSSALATLDELGAGLDALIAQFASVAASAGDLSAVDDAISALSAVTADATAEVDGLNSVISSLSSTVAEDNQIISSLNETVANLEAQISALTLEETAANETTNIFTASLTALGEMATSVGEALSAAQGPLMIISALGIVAAKSFIDMGMKSEDALNQVQALAGVGASDMAKYTAQLEAQAIQFGESLDQEAQGLFYVTSAGFQNADAMKVLGQAVEDAKSGHVGLDIAAKALDASLNAYGASANQATQYNDYMMQAVTKGVQTFGDFADAISKAAVEGHAAHISFNQVAAAESEMTTVGMTARQASMDLTSMMKALDGDIDKTAKTAQKLGLHFNEAAFKTMDLFHQMLYLQGITKGNQTELSKLTGGSAGLAAFNALMTKNADGSYKFAQSLDNMKNSTGAAAQAFQTSQETISEHMEKIGAAFSVISYKTLEALAPTINKVADVVGHAADFISQHMNVVMPILAGLASMFGVILVAALAAFVGPMLAAAAPFLAIAAAIGLVVTGAMLLAQHWNQITTAMGKNPAIQEALKIFQTIGGYLSSIFAPVLAQLETTWKTQLEPSFKQMGPLLNVLKPLFEGIGLVIGGIVVVSLGILAGILAGVVKALAALVTGLTQFIGGVIQFATGLLQFVGGVFAAIIDIVTGNGDKLKADTDVIWDGMLNIAKGFGDMFMGFFGGLFSAVIALFSGFYDGVVGYFTRLYDTLVGHSIVPDMINGIVQWFGQLPGRALSAVQSLASMIGGFFSDLANQALQWGSNIVTGIANGITNAIGKIGSAIGSVTQFISDHLPHSPAKIGPLRDLAYQGQQITEQVSQGMIASIPKLQIAIGQVVTPIATNLNPTLNTSLLPSSTLNTSSIGSGNDQATTSYLAQMVSYLATLVQLQQQQGTPNGNGAIQSSPLNAQKLNQVMQSLSGYGIEGVMRGGY